MKGLALFFVILFPTLLVAQYTPLAPQVSQVDATFSYNTTKVMYENSGKKMITYESFYAALNGSLNQKLPTNQAEAEAIMAVWLGDVAILPVQTVETTKYSRVRECYKKVKKAPIPLWLDAKKETELRNRCGKDLQCWVTIFEDKRVSFVVEEFKKDHQILAKLVAEYRKLQ